MIRELSVRPVPTNKNAKAFFLGSLFLALVSLVAYFSVDKYRGIVGLFIIVFLTAGILVYTKYISAQYYYDVTFDSNGAPVFVVRQVTGKRQTTLCRVDLYAIRSVTLLEGENKKQHKAPDKAVRYVYTPTLFPSSVYLIYVKSSYEHAELMIECSEEFASLLMSYADEARAQRVDDEE